MRNHLTDDVLNMSPSLITIQVVKGGRFCFSVSVGIITSIGIGFCFIYFAKAE